MLQETPQLRKHPVFVYRKTYPQTSNNTASISSVIDLHGPLSM
jgi:hypothetical protein